MANLRRPEAIKLTQRTVGSDLNVGLRFYSLWKSNTACWFELKHELIAIVCTMPHIEITHGKFIYENKHLVAHYVQAWE